MNLAVTAGFCIVTSLALAIGCHHEDESSTMPAPPAMTPSTPPMATAPIAADGGIGDAPMPTADAPAIAAPQSSP